MFAAMPNDPVIGAVYPQAEIGNDPLFIRDFAQAIEGAGYSYLTAFDHIYGADISRFDETPIHGFPTPPYLADDSFHEVFTLFSHLAAVTTTLRFRPRVVILPQRETGLVAKQATTLDRLSGQRLMLAVGVGWNFAEYEGLGADFSDRGKRLDEQLRVLKELWANRIVTFDGDYHHLDRVGINPLPAAGSIPLWIGSGPQQRSLRRVAEHADGWIALLTPEEDLAGCIGRLHELLAAAGRPTQGFGIETLIGAGTGEPDDWRAARDAAVATGVNQIAVTSGRNLGRSPADHLSRLLEAADALAS